MKMQQTILEHFDVSDRDMVKFIIGTIGDIDTPMNPAAKGNKIIWCIHL